MKLKLIILSIVSSLVIVACGDSTTEKVKNEEPTTNVTHWERYVNKDLNFSGLAPAGWTVQEKPGEMLVLSPQDMKEDKFREYFSIKLIPIQPDQVASIDSTAAYNMAQAKNRLTDFEAYMFDKVNFEGIDAYEAAYKGTIKDMALIWHTVFLIKDNVFYTLLFNYEADKNDTYKEIGFKFFDSFTFKPLDSIQKDPAELGELPQVSP